MTVLFSFSWAHKIYSACGENRLLSTVLAKSSFWFLSSGSKTSFAVMFKLCSGFIAYGREWDGWEVKRMQDLHSVAN